ncbi:MAG: hypothetical protein ACR2IE_06735 [Candidatus Sumerlaeaceae bacterium]
MLAYMFDNLWATLALLAALQVLEFILGTNARRAYDMQSHYVLESGYTSLDDARRAPHAPKPYVTLLRGGLVWLVAVSCIWYFCHTPPPRSFSSTPLPAQHFLFDAFMGLLSCIYVHSAGKHLINIAIFQHMAKPGRIEGTIRLSATVMQRIGAIGLMAEAAALALYGAMVFHPFFLGGAVGLFAGGAKVYFAAKYSEKRQEAIASAFAAGQEPPPEVGAATRRYVVMIALWLILFLLFIVLFNNWNRDADPAPIKRLDRETAPDR